MGRIRGAAGCAAMLCLAACGHTRATGAVVKVPNENVAQVRLNDGNVRVGDRVVVLREHCQRAAEPALGHCWPIEVGSADVVTRIDRQYVEVRPREGLRIEPGDTVQRRAGDWRGG